jgi:hypothetical protein
LSNFELCIRTNVTGPQIASAGRALTLVKQQSNGVSPSNLSVLIQEQLQDTLKNKSSYSEGITPVAAWQIFFDEREKLDKVAIALNNNGYIDPFWSVDPNHAIREWAYETVDQSGTEKDRLLSLAHGISRLYEIVIAKGAKRKDLEYGEREENIAKIFFNYDSCSNQEEISLRNAFLLICVARAAHLNCGIMMDGKYSKSWIEIDGKCRGFDIKDTLTIMAIEIDAKVAKNKKFEFRLPVIDPGGTTARTIFSVWHQLKGESSAEAKKINEAEAAYLKALEIDPGNMDCIDLLRDLGKKSLISLGCGDPDTVIKEYAENILATDKQRTLEKYAKDHISIRMALNLAAINSGYLEWREV